jgi:hypothetical protein
MSCVAAGEVVIALTSTMVTAFLLFSEQSTHLTRAAVVAIIAIGFAVAGLHPALRSLPEDGDEPPLTRKEQRIFVVLAVLLLAVSVRELALAR